MKSKKKIWIRFGISAAFAVIFLLFALFAGKFAPYDPLETHYTDLLKAPCKQYLLGTDQMGRDIFSRILYGGKTSLLIAFAVTAIISVVGILVGTAAGFWGGAFDAVLMRLSDMLMAFPGSIFTIALVSFLGTGLPNLILAMTLTGWTYYARISRSLVLSIKNNTYIEQARLGGARQFPHYDRLHYPKCYAFPSGKYHPGYWKQASDDCRTFPVRTWLPAAYAGMGLHAFRRKRLYVFSALDAYGTGNGNFDKCYYIQLIGRLYSGSDESQRKKIMMFTFCPRGWKDEHR